MLGNSILNSIVNEEKITSPEKILEKLDQKIVNALDKQSGKRKMMDGMDMVVILFDEISYTLHFAGAKNPLYYVRDYEIHQIKGSSIPIGINPFKKDKDFELHEMQVHEGDIFYLCSDGFQDQAGGNQGQKYLKKRLRQFLLKISHLPLAKQKEKIEEEFLNWKGHYSQTDDVLMIGIKF